MGIVCSRPISDFLEDGFLKVAQAIDYMVRLTHKYIHTCVSFCVGTVFGRDSEQARAREAGRLCFPDNGGLCLIQSTHIDRRKDEKRRRSERRKRAEAAALGRKITRKRRGPAGQGYDKVAGNDPEDQRRIQMTLGEPALAPPARLEAERETAAERQRGKLWIMGNVKPSHQESPQMTERMPLVSIDIQRQQDAMKEKLPGKAQLSREGYPAHSEHYPPVTRVGNHSSQPSTDLKAAQHIHFEVIASSSEPAVKAEARRSFELREDVAKRMAGQRSNADTIAVMKEVRPRVSSKPSPLASSSHAKPEAAITASASQPAIFDSGAVTVRKQPQSGPITDVSGKAMLKLSAAPLTTPFEHPVLTSKAKQELRKHKTRHSFDVRPITEDLVQNTPCPAAYPAAAEAGSGPPLKRLFKISGSAIRPRASFDANGMRPNLVDRDDASSIAGSEHYASSIRAPSPFGMVDLADKACLFARDAPRKERKVWKDEVEKIAIQRCLQQDAMRRNQGGKQLRRVETNDSRLNSGTNTPSSLGARSGASTPQRTNSPPLKRRHSEKGGKRTSLTAVATQL